MATPIGGITIDIDAKVTKLEESLKRANNDLKKFEKQSYGSTKNIEKNVSGINKSFQMLGASIAGFAAGIGIRTFIDLGRYALGFADDLATAADQAGIGAVRFQSLRETFRILEIDGAAFEKSMVRLNGTLGDVLRGSVDEATKALEQMGLTSKILSGEISTTDQLLDGIADSAKSFGTQAEFTSAVVDIFGRRVGGQLAPALAKGTKAINEMEQAAIDAGIVIDELSLNKLADANEAVERFTVQTQMQFVSWFGSVISGFEDLGLAIEGWKMKLAEPISWGGVKEFFTMTNREAANLARYRNANPMSGAVSGAFGAFQNISNRVQSLTAPRAPSLSTGGGRSGGGRARSGGGAPKISDEQRLTQEFEKQVLANERILELQTTRHQGFEVAADIQEAYYQLQEKFPKLEQGRLEILRHQLRQIELQKDSYAEIQGIMADWQGSEFIADQEAIADSLEDLMKTNGFGADAIEGNNVRIAKSFKDMANETLSAVQEMTNALQGGSFLDILGAFINVGLQLGSIGLFGKGMQTNINKSVPGYARGTNSAKAGLAMVGEEGPEMVLFGGGERVVPNDKLRSARSGTTDIQVIPSPYFDVVVDGRVMNAAPGIAQGGAALASQRSAFANSRRLA